ncbi:Caspase domain-containing protein [Tistlia consotensis]|uniref:Caspase domain-containing protein n=1 Tax=Tistlia consotensis USBA 355 TaxID=560819 RepID=A0A1Y6C0A3_9PROT|nr:caspase family protein [Tistlia consotensis]SMF29800.1 Caspase domain-containing protein [Tistlia consotensis USBA 355]SNR90823.1 Caspase domain-containing protein [Tistlia consotensis]
MSKDRTGRDPGLLADFGAQETSLSQLAGNGTSGRKRSPSRFALVIGNSDYGQLGELPNAARDAELIANRLRAVGFEAHLCKNLRSNDINRLFQAFVQRLRHVGNADTVIFYFAGHGYQDGDKNYLLPIIIEGDPFEPIPLQDMMAELSGLSKRRLVFFDACRSSFNAERVEDALVRARGLPAEQRPALRRGLADFAVDDETFISFSAAPGKPASDGAEGSPNSPYATALSRFIDEVDLPLSVMMARVRNSVWHDTREAQRTWDSSSLESSFFFKPSSLLFLFGNMLALIAFLVALVSLGIVLYEGAVAAYLGNLYFGNLDRWEWSYISAAVLALTIAVFLYGVGRAYSRVRGAQSEWQTEGEFRLFRRSSAGTNGAIGGVLGGILGSALVTFPYWIEWRAAQASCSARPWADPTLPDVCPHLGQLIAEGSVAGIYILVLLGFLSMHFSEWLVRGRPAGLVRARKSVQMVAGAMLGGVLAGVVVGPVITAYFGAQDRPFLEPRSILVWSILAVALMAFSIVNYKLETFTRARLLRSLLGAAIGTVCALAVLSGLVGILYWTGFIENTLAWANAGFYDPTKTRIEQYAFLLVAGLPYGIVFGLSFGVLVAATRLFSERSESAGNEPQAS